MTVDTFTPALNALLPMDVRILKSCEAPPDFHARRDARRRTYRYYMNPGSFLYPWERRYCLALFRKPDLSLLNAMAECFIGVHDFTAFCRDDVKQKSTTRQVSCSAFFYQGNSLVYQISGNAFLWKMVRSIVGTILEFEKAGRSAADVAAVLAGKRRKEAGITAPAYPLFLHHIEYGDRE